LPISAANSCKNEHLAEALAKADSSYRYDSLFFTIDEDSTNLYSFFDLLSFFGQIIKLISI